MLLTVSPEKIFVINYNVSEVCLAFMVILFIYSIIKCRNLTDFSFILSQFTNLLIIVGCLLFSMSRLKYPDNAFLSRGGFTIMVVGFELVAPTYLGYIARYLKLRASRSKILFCTIGPVCIVLAGLLVYNAFTENLFHISNMDAFGVRGLRFWPFFVMPAISVMCIIYKFILSYKKMRKSTVVVITLFIVLPLTGALLQGISGGYAFFEIASSISLFAVYYNSEALVREQFDKKQRDYVDSKIALMMTTLSLNHVETKLKEIAGLCDENPQEAKNEVRVFAKELRVTIDAVNENLRRQVADDGKV